ncbi:hypothetical protein J6590_033123 [Homalodisca vitripennis]|nr:hypothetical protein J6590_033123 [Homalodisca vitripennis]
MLRFYNSFKLSRKRKLSWEGNGWFTVRLLRRLVDEVCVVLPWERSRAVDSLLATCDDMFSGTKINVGLMPAVRHTAPSYVRKHTKRIIYLPDRCYCTSSLLLWQRQSKS